jgi:hypothetical protein
MVKDGKIDLPDDDPAVVKLFIQFLYEDEYDPKIPEEATIAYTSRGDGYTYDFPHTCGDWCTGWKRNVCPHHYCDTDIYDIGRHSFVCYICAPPEAKFCPDGDSHQLLLHSKVYEAAEMYDIKGLKELARRRFSGACTKYWDEDEFVEAANHACTTTPEKDRGLRDVIIKTIADHTILLDKALIEELLSQHGDITLGVLKNQLRGKTLMAGE